MRENTKDIKFPNISYDGILKNAISKTLAVAPLVEKFGRNLDRLEVRAYLAKYNETGNSLYAWMAYRHCIDKNIKIPDWIMEYFYEGACNLEYLANLDDRKRANTEIQNALKLGRCFIDYENTKQDIEIYSSVELFRERRKRNPKKLKGVNEFERVAKKLKKYNLTSGAVKKAYYRIKKLLMEKPL